MSEPDQPERAPGHHDMDDNGLRYFDPQPLAPEVPERFPDPMRAREPHPLAQRAARELMRELKAGLLGDSLSRDGKMLGVLVVRDDRGRLGYLRAFSGMVEQRWMVDGFAPPVFDLATRNAFWRDCEAELGRMTAEVEGARAVHDQAKEELQQLLAAQSAERTALRELHRQRRSQRKRGRASADDDEHHRLDQESRGDGAEKRALAKDHRTARAALEERVEDLAARARALDEHRRDHSNRILARIQALYSLIGHDGTRPTLQEIFAPDRPPGGAGDCAAPKLLVHARRHGLLPVALAEFWWGATPATGGRHSGVYYPPCRGRCEKILSHLLSGLAVEVSPLPGADPIAPDEPAVVFEDEWLVAVHKPRGLLSVPGRDETLRDSVLTRLQSRYPLATGPLLVHRLDLDTSGILLAAKRADVFARLHRAFAAREVEKRYIARLSGEVASDSGRIELALRVDLDDRPRQIVDPVHGKPALTHWRVLERSGESTRIEFAPITGRTHQLRVHAAHPRGLAAPIVGDRLYGLGGGPLLLHAERLALTHPVTGTRLELRCPAPF